MSRLKRLISEIHDRSLWQVLAIYIAASWAVLEAADVLIERLALPDWIYGLAIILLLVGLPIVLATAFVQEGMAPGGTEAEAPVSPADAAIEPASGDGKSLRWLFTWRNAWLGGMAAFALWGVVAAGWLLLAGPPSSEVTAADRESSIAVLPFDNLSPSEEDRFFADGIHDEILTHLARIGDLKVISRTSVLEYRNSPKNIREIASKLGVATILEGTVRRVGDEVRITAQLIDAGSDRHLWAEAYERELADIFAIQADVAERIADALAAELTPETRARIERRPTDDMEAYNAYLQGKDAGRGYAEQDIRLAIQMYERAVELDPEFAVAWAELAEQQANLYWFHYDRSDAPLRAAKRAIDRALALDPELPEAYLARGWYYYHGHLEYDRALRDLERARDGLPNDASVLYAMAMVRRRQGRFDVAVNLLRQAVELDPRSETTLYVLAETLELRREYSEALRVYDRTIGLAPDHADTRIGKARVLAGGLGDLDGAWATIEPAFQLPRGQFSPAYYGVLIQLYARDFSQALNYLEAAEEEVFQTQFYYLPRTLVRARILDFMDRSGPAQVNYDSARVFLKRRLAEDQQDPRFHSALGLALAGLDRKAEAIRAGEKALQLLPMSAEAWRGGNLVIAHTRILTRVREAEAAIDRLERMLSVPSELTPTGLRLDPTWDPLRDHPRFQSLLEKYSKM